MRKVIVSEFVTLDGTMDDPGGSDRTKHGGWSFQTRPSADQLKYKFDELFAGDDLLLGRVTYQGFAAAWPLMPPDEQGYTKRMNGMPKHVVSKTLDRVEWTNSTLIKGDLQGEVSNLKNQPGQDILVFGSRELVNGLLQSDLVDEVRLFVYPMVLGTGKRLFKDGVGAKLKLVESRAFESGVVLLRYQPIAQA